MKRFTVKILLMLLTLALCLPLLAGCSGKNGKTLIELSLRRKYGINVVGLRKEGKLMINIDPEMALRKEMTLGDIASKQSLKKLV